MFVLDTDILVDLYRRFRRTEEAVKSLETRDRLAITPISVQELVQGTVSAPDSEKAVVAVERLLGAFEILEYDAAAAWVAGKISGDLRKLGTPIGDLDTMIAACTIGHNGRLVTRNVKHFQRIPDLHIHPLNE